jgi:phosphoserine aminotransferase
MKKINFNPGPSMMPESVLAAVTHSLANHNNTGLSIAEISHRSPAFLEIIEEATASIRELYGIKDEFDVLWMPGGASTQMALAPLNLVNPQQNIAILETGYWAKKAIAAAAQICKVNILASSAATNFDRIPKPLRGNWQIPRSTQYLHVVSNETIEGTQYHNYPSVSVPLVADMTSDFLSRPLPLDKFGIIYASAQKNFGMAGITCVLIRKSMLEKKVKRTIPTIFNYKTHIESQSLYHTCPTVPIYTSMLALRWTKEQGGLAEIQRRNAQKARVLYEEVDKNPLFEGIAVKEDRSVMNVCFTAISPELEARFFDFTEKNGIVGIKGFPTIGGFRASIYNAMPIENVKILGQIMQSFSEKYG